MIRINQREGWTEFDVTGSVMTMSKTHLQTGTSTRTWCGIPAGFHVATKTSFVVNRVDCRRCLASLKRYQREHS